MTVKALTPVRTVNLVAPLAHKATDMHTTETAAPVQARSGAATHLIGSSLRVGGLTGEIFDKDFAPHINLMNRLGDPDYGKPGLPRPHIDTRDVTPRKKKAMPA